MVEPVCQSRSSSVHGVCRCRFCAHCAKWAGPSPISSTYLINVIHVGTYPRDQAARERLMHDRGSLLAMARPICIV